MAFIVSPACSTRRTPTAISPVTPSTKLLISLAEVAQRCARLRTSPATTANPLPCSLGSRGLHGGVQRQNIGLEGDAVDHAGDIPTWRALSLIARILSTALAISVSPLRAMPAV